MGSFVFCPNKPKNRASACENCKAKRSKSADLCTAMHAPVICMTVGDMPVYANEPLSGWKIKPLVPSNRIFSRSDGDKFVCKPLDFELL